MTAIDRYLTTVAKRLLLRRRARLDALDEMRAHLEELEARRGAAFPEVAGVATDFGEPRALARRINATVPWTKARLPITLLLSGPLAMLALAFAMAPIDCWIVPHLNHRGLLAPTLLACLMALTWMVYYIGPALSLLYGLRIGARPAHCCVAILVPFAILTVGQVAAWLTGDLGYIPNRINEAIGLGEYGVVSALFCALATSASAHCSRIRLALPLVACAAGLTSAAVTGLPDDLGKYAPALGSVLGALLLGSLLPWLAWREPELPRTA